MKALIKEAERESAIASIFLSVVNRIFLLSPARAGGRRAQLLMRSDATFQLARQVQIGDATLGDVFAFCSGLYFRGKLIYARRFAQAIDGIAGVQIITPSRGLLSADTRVCGSDLREFASVAVDSDEPRFTQPGAISLAAIRRDDINSLIRRHLYRNFRRSANSGNAAEMHKSAPKCA